MKKLVEALVKAQSEMTSAVASGTNPHFKSEYAPLDEVIKAVKKPLNSNGIFFLQKVYVADNGQCVETEFHGHDSVLKGGKVFVKCDKSTAQGYGSSLSYAKRYSLQTACGLPTGDDDDANTSTDEVKPVEKKQDEKENNAKKYVENMLKTIETFGDDVEKIQGILTAEKNAKVLARLQEGYPEIYKGFYDVVEKKVKEVEQKTNSQGE